LTKYRVIEANDQSSEHAVLIAHAWVKAFPGITWAVAEVDQNEGLMLVRSNRVDALHFTYASCGHDSLEPTATAEVLAVVGFGARQELLSEIIKHQSIRFERDGDGIVVRPQEVKDEEVW
jgi:hypothetical protein